MDKRTSVTIALDFPIEIAGVAVKSVTMRRPKVRDELAFQKAKGTEGEKALYLLASLCELSPDELMELDAADLKLLEEQYVAFRGGGSQTSGEG